MTGYSKRPLHQKLGIKPNAKVAIINEPFEYWEYLGFDSGQLIIPKKYKAESLDFIHLFSEHKSQLEQQLINYVPHLKKSGMCWISWPKKSSSIASDLSKFIIFELGQASGLVDVKIASITDEWSGLKFVYRIKDR